MTTVTKNRKLGFVVGGGVKGALAVGGLLILAALLIDSAALGLIVGFIVFGLVLFAVSSVPIRYTMMTLLFFVLVLPNPAEGQPTEWAPPFNIVGKALLNHLNTVDGALSMIPVSSMEILFFFVLVMRAVRGPKIEGKVLPTPKPLIKLAYLALATAGFTWFLGLMSGGDFSYSLWQVNAVIYVPIVFLLFQSGFRGPEDLLALGKVVIAAAIYKCGLALYVVNVVEMAVDPATGLRGTPPYATSHADSMLFAAALLIVLGVIIESFKTRTRWLMALLVPVIMAGMLANNRRLVWVQVSVVLFMVYLLSRETKLKRTIRRSVKLSMPVFLLYAAAGWNSASAVFKPVRIMRSVIDAKSDASSFWREIENFNIIVTFRKHPIFGSGFGHPYDEVVPMPAVDYSLERYIPHNSLLGLWAYMGGVGFTGLTLLWIGGVYFAVLAYRHGQTPIERVGAMVSFGAVPIYLLQSWGDLGLNAWTGVFLIATSLAVGGKLAVATGSWVQGSRRKTAPLPAVRAAHDVQAAPTAPADVHGAAPPFG